MGHQHRRRWGHVNTVLADAQTALPRDTTHHRRQRPVGQKCKVGRGEKGRQLRWQVVVFVAEKNMGPLIEMYDCLRFKVDNCPALVARVRGFSSVA